jgi:hypothetical protein
MSDFSCASAKKSQGRPKGSLGAKARAIREAVDELTREYAVMTVRQVFYALTVRGVVPKDENAGYRPVQAHLLKMRREGLLDWSFISDATRWMRKPVSYDSLADALETTARAYRRNLWRSQDLRVEVWLEKDALAGVVLEATRRWDVGLMVSRGTSSATFLYEAAQSAREAAEEEGIATYVFTLYDLDAAGERCHRTVERGLREYAPDAPIMVERLAVTPSQVAEWKLPSRPAKTSDPEAHKFAGEAVELDAIPPNILIELVQTAIVDLIDADAWRREQVVEQSEREILERMAAR